MIKYSIGYNHDISFLKLMEVYKKHINEVYFPAPYKIMSSGRALKQDRGYEEEITGIIKQCKNFKLRSNLLLNPTCEGNFIGEREGTEKILRYIKKLSDMGLTSVTITNPLHINSIKRSYPHLEIHSSINSYVKNPEHAKYLKSLGVDTITIDRDINRNINLIKEIKTKTKVKIKVLINEGCLRNCPFRHAHFNMIAHGKDTDFFDAHSCTKIYEKNPEKAFMIPFVRPEDIKHYMFADYLKISTRSMPTLKVASVLSSYIDRKHNGNLLHLLSTKGLFKHFDSIDNSYLTKHDFFKKLSKCDNDCSKCDYCRKLVKNAAVLR